ncbi:hypothetical protein COH20_003699 [Aspergillus flavus]|uniref:Zn(2)-C6 fungal-type domain-containing protein n=2 Tax=Aspergillus subgen. Circumdati TaxID=2720871 RepID=A0AB74C5C8_ASPFL|nr:hypothetical protein COH20_003699 [Aspergillus flavus]RAQ75232.1 hypothetical protein COH21_002256 [Aspergillus flavus]RMZ41276.1 hypothetical protein CA14_001336 [Aspergillus flavus]
MARSCGTCRDRRISCDRATPTCGQCARSNRLCKGYGVRLSWPKASNSKRAVVGVPSYGRRPNRRLLGPNLVNVSDFDIKMHYYLANSTSSVESTASKALATLAHDSPSLGRTILRMALTNDSASSAAVREALLAFASVHRHGLQSQGIEFKVSAIRALGKASHTNIGVAEALQHVAACMLLCAFEIHTASCTSSEWWCFVNGVKQVLNASALLPFRNDSSFAALLDWVFHHETLGWFSFLHWRPEIQLQENCRSAFCTGRDYLLPTSSNKLLRLFKECCYILGMDSDLGPLLSRLHTLAENIANLHLPDTPHRTTLELFRLSMLIWLNRMTGATLEPQSTTDARVQRALHILSDLKTCPRQLPLFIIGCEARTDEDRCVILELMNRTEASASSRSMFIVKALTEAVWKQDDLAGERELGYREKITAIVSVCSLLPTFA